MTRRFRTYLKAFTLPLACGVAGVAAFNALIDPFGAYPDVNLAAVQRYRAAMGARETKGELARQGDFHTLLLGSSRVRVGIPTRLSAYGDVRVGNLGLDDTTLAETRAVLDYALRHNPTRRVILGVDFHMFNDTRGKHVAFDLSRFNPRLEPFEYHARNLLGGRATDESWSMLRAWLGKKPTPMGTEGFVPRAVPEGVPQRDVIARRLRPSRHAAEPDGATRRSESLEHFRAMVRQCRERGVELHVFVPPVHALRMESLHVQELWTDFERWKREITIIAAEEGRGLAAVWDFTGYTGYVAEPIPAASDRTTRMKFYLEASHFTPLLGERVIERMLGKAAEENFGVRLTAENIDAHLANIRRERETFLTQFPEEVVWLKVRMSETRD